MHSIRATQQSNRTTHILHNSSNAEEPPSISQSTQWLQQYPQFRLSPRFGLPPIWSCVHAYHISSLWYTVQYWDLLPLPSVLILLWFCISISEARDLCYFAFIIVFCCVFVHCLWCESISEYVYENLISSVAFCFAIHSSKAYVMYNFFPLYEAIFHNKLSSETQSFSKYIINLDFISKLYIKA